MALSPLIVATSTNTPCRINQLAEITAKFGNDVAAATAIQKSLNPL
jgi:hypothetical protein